MCVHAIGPVGRAESIPVQPIFFATFACFAFDVVTWDRFVELS